MAGLLAESFEVLADELRPAYERMCAELAGKAVAIRVDEERFVVVFGAGGAEVRATDDGAHVDTSIVTSKRAIEDVMDARRSLADAVLADEVEAVAPLERLVELQVGLGMYVHGAVRCEGFPRLVERFRAIGAGAATTPRHPMVTPT